MSPVVRESASLSDKPRRVFSCVIALLVGAAIGVALAQDRPPGQLDSACAAQCVASGQDADYCDKVCWIPSLPTRVRSDEVTDWVCMSKCRDMGGRYADCKPRCKMRPTN